MPPQLLPLHSFLRETVAFLASHTYLLTAELSAFKEASSDLGMARIGLKAKIPSLYGDPIPYFLARLFISHVASFEVFLQDTVSLVAHKNPKKVGASSFTLAEVLDAETPSELVQRAIDEYLNKIMYKKPAAYLEDVCQVLSIQSAPLVERWKTFIEAKARRDLGVHAAWRCNETYLRKVRDAGLDPRAKSGDPLLPTKDEYLTETMATLDDLALEITAKVAIVHWPEVDMGALDLDAT